MLVVVCAPMLIGCRLLQSESQQKQNLAAGPTAIVNGQTLTLSASLSRRDLGKRQFDLAGQIEILAPAEQLSALDIHHFSLLAAKAGYYVLNFRKKDNGEWIFVGRALEPPALSVDVSKGSDRLILKFVWERVGGGLMDNPNAYDAIDVSVSLQDQARRRYVLALPAVPTRIEK